MIIQAARFAFSAHFTQKRKYTDRPYFDHVSRVAGRVAALRDSCERDVCVAYLHDWVEDCCEFREWESAFLLLQDRFDSYVSEGVRWLTSITKESQPTLNRAARKNMSRVKLSQAPVWVKRIKLIDRIDNIGEMGLAPVEFRKTYLDESRLLLECLSGAGQNLEVELERLIETLL